MRLGWLVLVFAGCGGSRVDDVLALTGDAAAGQAVYQARCALCHGDNGEGGTGPAIAGEDELEELVEVVLFGEGDMSGFDGVISDQEVADVVAFVQTLTGVTTCLDTGIGCG